MSWETKHNLTFGGGRGKTARKEKAMEGYIKIEAVDGGIAVQTRLKDMSIIDKAILIDGIFDALDIDISDASDVAMFCGLASLVRNHSGRTKVDMGAIRQAAERVEEDDGDGA